MEGVKRLELSVRGILRNFGLKLGRVSKGRWEERVRELTSGNAMLSDAVAPIMRLRAHMRGELAARRGKKRATTALARRMGVVLLRMWRDGTEFRFTREPVTAPDPA